jgi:septal ring factor EnvC (AmiA/AmiB activator)
VQRAHAEEMARLHERLRSSTAQRASLEERLIHAEARIEQLGHQLKRAEEVVAGKACSETCVGTLHN